MVSNESRSYHTDCMCIQDVEEVLGKAFAAGDRRRPRNQGPGR